MESRAQVESDTSSAVEGSERCARDCACTLTQSCPTLCNPMDCSPPGSSVLKIFQARILEWVPFPTSGDLPKPGTEPISLESPELAGRFFTTSPPVKPMCLSSFLTGRGKKAIKHTW